MVYGVCTLGIMSPHLKSIAWWASITDGSIFICADLHSFIHSTYVHWVSALSQALGLDSSMELWTGREISTLRRWYSSGRDRSASECISSQDHWRLKLILSKAEWCERENEGLLTRARRIRGGGNTNQSPEGQEMNQLRQEQGSQDSGQMEQQGEKPGTRKVLVCLRAKGRFLRLG